MVTEITQADIQSFFKPRLLDSHKGTFGHLALIAGSSKYVGAAFLSAQAAINSGVGLITVIAPKKIVPLLSTKLNEAIIIPLEDEQLVIDTLKTVSVVAVGPGLEETTASISAILYILEACNQPLIFDASALQMIAQLPLIRLAYIDHQKRALHPEQTLMTPHPGEAARLLACSNDVVQKDRIAAITALHATFNCTFLLKGHHTLITSCPEKNIWQNGTGTPYMASGGMGDVLTGMIASFVAQGLTVEEASLAGAFLHGAIAEQLAESMFTVPANFLVQQLPFKLREFIMPRASVLSKACAQAGKVEK